VGWVLDESERLTPIVASVANQHPRTFEQHLYVALTRARKTITIVGATSNITVAETKTT
jgi:ATP-dependent exoDNAse (exonuclease V) alpha subunit